MTAPVRARQCAYRAWIARAVMAVAVIGGLFAMHGLPTMGVSGMSHAGPLSSQSMVAQDMARVLLDEPKPGAEPAAVLLASLVRTTEVPAGCGMDHANCVAVLRAQHHPEPVAVLSAIAARPPDHPAPARDQLARCDSRAPPDISLTGLCISRT